MMNRIDAIEVEKHLKTLDEYQSVKIKEAVAGLRVFLQPVIDRNKREDIMKTNNLKYSYKTYEPVKQAQQVITTLVNAVKFYEEASDNLAKTQGSTQDILHAIELLDLTEEEMVEMVKELHGIRLVRREAKDFIDIMLPLYDLASKYQHIAKEFGQAIGEMKRTIEQKENRKYTPREKSELTEKFNGVKKELK